VKDVEASRKRVVRDDAAMTAPPQNFGAHDRARLLAGTREQCAKRALELACLCVVRVVLERSNLPARIASRLRGLRCPSTSAEVALLDERDAVARQLLRERVCVELRIRAGPRKVPDVDERLDAMCTQRSDELLVRAIRVADREQLHFVAAALNSP
jgi:hypothetical protein